MMRSADDPDYDPANDPWLLFGDRNRRAVFVNGFIALGAIFVVLLAAFVNVYLAIVLMPIAMVLVLRRTSRLATKLHRRPGPNRH